MNFEWFSGASKDFQSRAVARQLQEKPSRSGPEKKEMNNGWIFVNRSQIVPRIQIYNFFKRFPWQKKKAQLFLLNDDNMQIR